MFVESANEPVQEPQVVESVGGSTKLDNFGPEMGWEFDYAAKHNLAYPVLRTLADIVPFASFGFPSGRKEFMEASTTGKAFHLGLDALAFVPMSVIGKGIKVSVSPMKYLASGLESAWKRTPFAMKNLATQPASVLDEFSKKVDQFVYRSAEMKLIDKYGLTREEAQAVQAGTRTRLAGNIQLPISIRPQFRELWKTPSEGGALKPGVYEDVVRFTADTADHQRLRHYKQEWGVLARQVSRGKENLGGVFKGQVLRLFGEDALDKVTLETVTNDQMKTILMDSLLNKGKIIRGSDLSRFDYLAPVRKAFGVLDKRFGVYEKIYKPVASYFSAANKSSILAIDVFHTRLVENKLADFTPKGKLIEFYSRQDYREAGKLARWIDNAQGSGVAQDLITKEVNTRNPMVQGLIKSYQEWTDWMYTDFMKVKLPQLFERSGLTEEGKRSLSLAFGPKNRTFRELSSVFSVGANVPYEVKHKIITDILEGLKGQIKENPAWFTEPEGEAVKRLLAELEFKDVGKKLGLPNYLQNYTTRVFEGAIKHPTEAGGVPEEAASFFTKARTNPIAEEASDNLATLVESRARAQSKELYVYPYLKQLKETIDVLPPKLKAFSNHYVSRLLGFPSEVDTKVASWINKTFGANWDEQRVGSLAYKINDLIYLGGIGFKPFSAMRNYVTPFFTVPADMGGIKDLLWIAKGFKYASKSSVRDYFKEIGIIAEYAPDLLFKPQTSKFANFLTLGEREIPIDLHKFRDFGMWMFKQSDAHTRYVTGGAAMAKWEHMMKKYTTVSSEGQFISGANLSGFEKALNLASREPWVAREISGLLRQGTVEGFEKAKAQWIKDIVGDTQFLYGPLESPLISQVGGSVAKVGLVFQTWWMNYASLLSKWTTRSGAIEPAADRMFTWMFTSALAYHAMLSMWPKRIAGETVFLGPLPIEPDLPASIRPVQEAVKLMIEAGGLPLGMTDMDKVRSRMRSVINTSMIFVPGGLQMSKMIKGGLAEGPKGIAKSLIRLEPAED